jgi:Tfp pilus assembly protein PilF
MQQLADHVGTADALENLVKQQPSNSLYWQQLAGTYLALANETHEDREIRRYQLRAVLTMERAQKYGHLKTPRDQLNIIGLYFNLEQYGKASDLLASGLESGQVENTQANWELLALAYQQNAKEERAVATLVKASNLFPAEGQIELSLAQMHYAAGRTSDAFSHLEKGAAKGNLKKPGAAYLFLGFIAYELQKFDEAVRWADAAAKEPDTKADDARRLKRAAQEALREREALKNVKI